MTTAALAALPAEASGSHARPGGSAGECALFEHGFEFLDAIHWDGFDLDGQLMPGGGNGQPIEWRTSGGYTIKIDRHTITVTDALGRNTVQHWGDPHENLNGKHIKDWGGAPGWDGSRRTLRLGDGSQLTMTATGAHGLVLETSIYDGDQELHLYNATNTIRHHGTNPVGARCREATQHDGETASFTTDAGSGVATYRNVYNEDAAFNRVDSNVMLGTTGGFANPNQVNDLFDDPRLGHT
ncbi:MAG: hypothetical protein J0L88_03580 [Xanthomonadales bacterium]|nr:hypothetical protein [Xanthomonadales bacterium]